MMEQPSIQSKLVLLNDEFVEYSDAKLHISDLAIQRGFGVFDFFKVVQGKPVFLKEHLARFAHSVSEMGLSLPYSEEVLTDRIKTLLERNNLPNSGVKITLTGGYSMDGFSLAEPNLILSQQAFSVNQELNRRGIKLISVHHQRQLPHLKTIDYLMAIRNIPQMKLHGAQDIVYYSSDGVTECPRANFFIVNKEGQILTAEKNVLSGISRLKILGFSGKGFSITQTSISLDEVYLAKEAFISSTTKNILPIVAIDNHVFGDGNPGPITIDLMRKYAELMEETIRNS